jgi:hypothetical protein
MSFASLIPADTDLTKINSLLLVDNEYVIPKAQDLLAFSKEKIALFAHYNAMYTLPTVELIEFLQEQVEEYSSAVEIGSGVGVIGRALNIKCTDNFCQDIPAVKEVYRSSGQPTIKYGSHVLNRDANWVAKKWSPDLIIGSWITHRYNGIDGNTFGPDEEEILKNCKKYIMLGHLDTHSTKPLLTKYPPRIIRNMPWYVTRSMAPEKNAIFIWEGLKG